MPKTGPNAGWRKVTIALWPNRHSPIARPIEVTVLPSPNGVGLIAVTRIYLPSLRVFSRSSTDRAIFAL